MASFKVTSLQTEQQTHSATYPLAQCPQAQPVDNEEQFHHSVVMHQKEKKDTETFPKIVKVFSLKPSLPVQIFRDHVTIVISPKEATAQPLFGKSWENEPCEQIEKETFNSSANNEGGKIQTYYDNKCVPNFQCTGISRRKSSRDTNFLRNQHIFGMADIDTMQLGEKDVQSGSLSGRTFMEEWFQIPCNSTPEKNPFSKNERINEAEVMVNARKKNVSEQELSNIDANKKRKRRKRRAIFQQAKTRRSKKRRLINDIKTIDQSLIGEEFKSDTVNQACSQVEYCGSFKDTETEMTETTAGTQGRSEKDTQESFQDSLAVFNGEPVPGETGVISKEPAGSSKGNGYFPSGTISSLPGIDIHQNRILHLKEKLAQQEQELKNLKRKKEFEGVLTEKAEEEWFEPKDTKDTESLGDNEVRDVSLKKDTKIWSDGKEIEEAVNMGEMDDLKNAFQKVIKSFSRTLDGKLYSTRRVPYYAHLPTRNYAVGVDYKRFSTGITNQLIPGDFDSQEEFLFQLGLLRIY